MAVLSGLKIVRVEATATDTGATAIGTSGDLEDPPTIQDYPVNMKFFMEAYAGGTAYPVVIFTEALNDEDIANSATDALEDGQAALIAAGNTFA
jgi:hypothetical protein